jgi:uncharacterized protein
MKGSKEDYIKYRVERATELFEDAQLLAQNKRWKSCINRLYYSSFQLVNAVLYRKAITARTHNGLKTKFFEEYIKTGIISAEYGKLYSRLIDWRQESDYSAYVEFEEEDISPLIEKVEEFNDILKKLINS